ncbi:uncharacterized protein AB675_9497 [Cyphellophora attinorum]|uniref:Uncharacterized protein n=1 Tax=Cyphellophora attinorum TaxID=1664694 RepID=A0A0N1H7K9_9EURO|nr:uncharacterized protein AB675_9497 [Phialophora attinorum]KPI42526.1 hypothetical protein AB675_9497 [Phialophora attinorum]
MSALINPFLVQPGFGPTAQQSPNVSSPFPFLPPTYHFSPLPNASMKPPLEFELSLPLRCRPRFNCVGVCAPFPPGEDVPGDLESGGAPYERVVEVGLKGVFVVVRVVGDVSAVCAAIESEVFVVIVRGWEVVEAEFVVVAEVVVLTEAVTVFAVGYVGGVRGAEGGEEV